MRHKVIGDIDDNSSITKAVQTFGRFNSAIIV